jgi:hypothetical protein
MRKKGRRALPADFTHAYSMLTVTGNAECLANMAFELISRYRELVLITVGLYLKLSANLYRTTYICTL